VRIMDAKVCKRGEVLVKNKCIKGIKWGFDLTGFDSAERFKALLNRNNLKSYKRKLHTYDVGDYHSEWYHYIWESPKIRLVTGNNPITGVYTIPKGRNPQKGFASFIGIQGNKEAVKKLVKDIKKTTLDIKDESPNRRGYI